MRRTTILAVGLLLAATMTGCGKGARNDPSVATAQSAGATAKPSATATSSFDPDAPIRFSKCMRENGMTWFPDPQNGKMAIKIPDSVDKKAFEEAQQACRQFAPNRDNAPKLSAEDLEKARQMAKCMRENGVPNFPDPQPDGGIHLDSKMNLDPESPTFKAAEQKCDQYMPKGPRGRQGAPVTGGGGA
ncbi:hypothetical protein [Actinoplanes regularis]|uniref:Lipoprotein n=1 Tax=Actinoplanes regularis TaxID=52697 RepID=A0A239BD98_9ACTN|nr:hypothetical protein [Actinoplanes regularis]GIE87912.1 hypothetical protein Are01nite_43920 [Actinoplanes regularis]SNS05531.1 hypothetical protein SAMN06264365_109114 [Actinoplanes regularis]